MERTEWMRLPRESARAYQYFEMYRDMGAERSITKVYRKCLEAGVRISLPALRKLARKWDWARRARLWDDHLEAERLAQKEKERRAFYERMGQVGKLLQAKAIERIQSLSPHELKPATALQYLQTGAVMERWSYGEGEGIPYESVLTRIMADDEAWGLLEALDERLFGGRNAPATGDGR